MIGTIVSVVTAYQRVRPDSYTRTAVKAYREYMKDIKTLDYKSKEMVLIAREAYEFKVLAETDVNAAATQLAYDSKFNQIVRNEFDPRRK